MSRQVQVDRKRSVSARPFSATLHRVRPSSGQLSQPQWQDQMQNTYTPTPLRNRPETAKTFIRQLSTQNDDKQKKVKPKKPKHNEAMQEQILNLKLKVNGLVKQLDHQRGKTQQMRKKSHRFSRVLNVEFQNQRLWNAKIVDSHRVQGIRNMYDNLKEEHEKLKKRHDQLLKSQKNTKQLQYLQYINALELELKNVNHRFEKITENSLQLLSHENNYESQARQYLLQQTQHQYQQLSQRYNRLKAKKQMLAENIEDRNRKIEFMDKYSKDLENCVRDLQRKNEKNIKQNQKLKEEVHLINKMMEDQKHSYQQELQALKQQFSEQIQNLKLEKKVVLHEKDQKINHLYKQNQYYQQMIRELRATNNQISQEIQMIQKNNHNTKIATKVIEGLTQKMAQEEQQQRNIEEIGGVITEFGKHNQQRTRKTADKKNSEVSVKMRKVQFREVSEIHEILKLKMIGQNISFDKISELLTYQKDPSLKEEDNSWNEQYISMKEVKQVLKQGPFNLDESRSTLLSRYIIEDVEQQFVYVDEFNQNYRVKVKSIFKSMLGQYPLVDRNQSLAEELKVFLERYGVNLSSMLNTMEPSGLISEKRFKDTLRSIGAEYSENLVDILLGKMAVKADNLQQLPFNIVFGQYQK